MSVHEVALKPVRPWAVRGFRMIARRRLRGAFRAVRLAGTDRLREAAIDLRSTPVVVYLNHPSWWDPLLGFVLSQRMFQDRPFYAPMDAAALERYRILQYVGMFGVELDSPRGAVQFLRSADTVLDGGFVLGVTPQGQFTDVRERPLQLRGGLAALLARRAAAGKVTVAVPLAVEYAFWDQRLPEALAMLGEPLAVAPTAGLQREDVEDALVGRLTIAQDALAHLSMQRDASKFATVLEGRRGSAGFYSLWEDLQMLAGRADRSGDHQAGLHRH